MESGEAYLAPALVSGGALADQAQGHPRGQACSARPRNVRAYTRTYFSKYTRVVGMKTTCTKHVTEFTHATTETSFQLSNSNPGESDSSHCTCNSEQTR